LGYAMLFWVK